MTKYEINIIGAIFCQVNIIKVLDQFNPLIISGNQKWKGAAPIFIRRAHLIIIIEVVLNSIILSIFIDKIVEKRNNLDARACVIKYLRADSAGKVFLLFFNKGKIDNKLISNPIQAETHESDEIVIKVPIIIELKNNILYSFIIKKKRIRTFINGV